MIKKKIKIIIALMCAASLLMACGSEVPELSEEQAKVVEDYAAMLLLKYDSSSPSRLLGEGQGSNTSILQVGDPNAEVSTNVVEPEISMDDVTINDPFAIEDSSTIIENTPSESSDNNPLVNYLSGQGIDISYVNHEILDSYSEEENAYFTLDATVGNTLLVLHFDLVNNSSEDKDVNLNQLENRYRVSVNGGSNKFVLTTMMSNDILSFLKTIPANSSTGVVAIAEISKEDAENIASIDFTIRGSDGSAIMKLE